MADRITGGFRSQRELLDFGKQNLLELNIYKALKSLGQDYVEQVTQILRAQDKEATGALIRSLDYEVVEEVDGLVLNLYSLFYLNNVINGRRAGAKPPPYRVLIPWIRARGIVPFKGSEKGLAIAMAKSIGKKGIKPQPRIQQTIDNIWKTKQDIIARAAQSDLEVIITKYLLEGDTQI